MITRFARYAGIALLAFSVAWGASATRLTPSSRINSPTLTSGARSTTVSIPAGTTTAIIAFYFSNVSANQAPTSVTLDGQTATKRVSDEGAGVMATAMYSVTGMSTGASKTLAWTNPSNQASMDIGIEYRDGTSTYGASDSDDCNACGTFGTVSLANSNGDEFLCAFADDTVTLTSVGSGQTILDQTTGTNNYSFTTKTTTGTSTTSTFTFSTGHAGFSCQIITTTASSSEIVNAIDGPTHLFRLAR